VSVDWPFGELPPLRYRVILCDPPWAFKLRSVAGEAKSPQAQYECMDIEAIKALPVSHLAADECALIMWATFPMLPQALDVMQAWGFKFCTGGAWAKQSSTGRKWAFGTGYRLRSAAEPFLLGTIGKPPQNSAAIRNLIVAPIQQHSRKPDAMHQMIETMFDGPRVELFARQRRAGWDAWGNQTEKFAPIKRTI